MEQVEQNSTEIEVFLQGESIPQMVIVRVQGHDKIGTFLEIATAHGFPGPLSEGVIFVEDASEPIAQEITIADADITQHSRVHVHHCRKIEVAVNYIEKTITQSFSPSTTIARVKRWAMGEKGYDLTPTDATEHTVEICGTQTRPDDDTHLGTLANGATCSVCFNLVAKRRVEG